MFLFYLANEETQVSEGSAKWLSPLPLDRSQGQKNIICYGDYFTAVRRFLEAEQFKALTKALSLTFNKCIIETNIVAIHVYLEKHGEFYHPARIRVVLEDAAAHFVLNVAVSEAGLKTIQKEFHILKTLNKAFSDSYLPKVYADGESITPNGHTIRMFLGEWFCGFHEFHISSISGSEKRIVVWDPLKGVTPLSYDQMAEIYRQVAFVLTYYYNAETCDQIYPWHHAAGDFIVGINKDMVTGVRLITARDYQPYIVNTKNHAHDLQSLMGAMLIFFIHLSIRIRLDRLDGVDEITWSNDIAVGATIDGFFSGLAIKPSFQAVSIPILDCFIYYLSTYSMSDLLELSHEIVDAYNPHAPEILVIKANLEKHIQDLHDCYAQMISSAE